MADRLFRDFLEERMKDPEFAKGLREAERDLDTAIAIYRAREAAGLTQKQLAERVGTSQQQISRLEQANYRGSLKTLYRIAEALGLEVEVRLVAPKENSKATA